MAGLQYYFFPTDFFYPKPQKSAVEGDKAAQQQSMINTETQTKPQEEHVARDLSKKLALVHHHKKDGHKPLQVASLIGLPPTGYSTHGGGGSDK